jgi:hypothetical protein
MSETNTLVAACDRGLKRVTKFLVHTDEPIAWPSADLLVARFCLTHFETASHAPQVAIAVGHERARGGCDFGRKR